MAKSPPGWKALLDGAPWFAGENAFPIAAYSEFMPPPRLGLKPYPAAEFDARLFTEDDPWGWHVTEVEEALELRPGLEKLGRHLVHALVRLGRGQGGHGISPKKLQNNPYWPARLAERAGKLRHERFVVLAPLALSRTQDDKGRVRWTLFGASEQGPARPFWKSFFQAPGQEYEPEHGPSFIRNIIYQAYGEPLKSLDDLFHAGFRILPGEEDADDPWPGEGPLPSWTEPFLWTKRQQVARVKYLLTFRPFGRLPPGVQDAYLEGKLHLLPFPGSLIFWGSQGVRTLQSELPLALQIPLLQVFHRHEGPHGIRVPQSGWMHEPKPGHAHPDESHGPVRNTFRRTNRWAKVLRDQDELALMGREDKLLHALFSTIPDDLGLYDKPLARNAQLWTHDFRLLLDGPNATPAQMKAALHAVEQGGMFGYRFLYPAMRAGSHEIYWHRPLAAWLSHKSTEPVVFAEAPLGYFTAYPDDPPRPDRAVELWPRLLQRDLPIAALALMEQAHTGTAHKTGRNLLKLYESWRLLGQRPLPRDLARSLLTASKHETLDGWLHSLPAHAGGGEHGDRLAAQVQDLMEAEQQALPQRAGARAPASLTYARTATRAFETRYWNTIAFLAEGRYRNKNNADCVRDAATQHRLCHTGRDLEALGDYLLACYQKIIDKAGMKGKALAGELPFPWRTDFDFSWSGGWEANKEGHAVERDLVIVIPGKDRSRAVIMADHYDTAYMADCYEKQYGGDGARLAAAGADDNHSATTALLLGASVFLELSKAGRLECDVWLIHLTGEEFPADCLGARNLCQQLVEGRFQPKFHGGRTRDLSKTTIQGVYVMDMIAHNNDKDRDIFQMSPGQGRQSLWLAEQAQIATAIWNASVPVWNKKPARKGKGRGRRSAFGGFIPEVAAHPTLQGEVRPPADPHSTLYNTDGQIFSDAGVPVVLFMENYDINRTGYHDTHDTMENIDLDYGAAVAAITIESVARAATEKL